MTRWPALVPVAAPLSPVSAAAQSAATVLGARGVLARTRRDDGRLELAVDADDSPPSRGVVSVSLTPVP